MLPTRQSTQVQNTPAIKKPLRNHEVEPALLCPIREISAPPTVANHRMAVGDDIASITPRLNSRSSERLGCCVDILMAVTERYAASSIFTANPISIAPPPIHSTQRTAANCSTTAIPASASK